MRGQKDLITMKKGVNKIENEGEKWYKFLQKCQMTDFCEKYTTLSQIISGTKCDRDKPQKEVVNKIELGIKKDQIGSDNVKNGGQQSGSSPQSSSMGVPPPPLVNQLE